MKGIPIWAIYNPDNNLFDRIVIRGFWIYRQQIFPLDIYPGFQWRDVPMFKRRK